MLLFRSLAFNLSFYVATGLIAILGSPALAWRKATIRVAQFWGRTVVFLLRVIGGTRVEFRGLENIPKGPLLVAAKHQSALETLALTIPFDDFGYVLKRELMWIPVVGWYFARGGMVPIDRSKGTRAMAAMNKAAAQAIREGRQLIIFPEGTRRPAGAPPAYKQGASHLYAALNVPCLPVALNTGLYWRRRGFRRMPGTTVIEFLPVIPPGLARPAFLKELQTRIETASDALLAEGRDDLARHGHPIAVAMGGSTPAPETSGTL
ncbi:lysophospholipid acyltransferase family protein [Methylorubrum extorquens]